MTTTDNPVTYDAALECLALLPLAPIGVPLDLLAEDLHLPGRSEVRELFAAIEKKGVDVKTWHDVEQGGRVAGVVFGSWARAKKIAGEYVESREAATV